VVGRDKISSVLQSGLDDGDVILAPTREDVRIAFKAVAGGPPILFGASAGAAWRAASTILPGPKEESHRLKLRFGLLVALAVLLLSVTALAARLFSVDIALGAAGLALGILVSEALFLLYVRYRHAKVALDILSHRVEISFPPIKGVFEPDTSEEARAGRAAPSDEE
jgi:hypothetical protein